MSADGRLRGPDVVRGFVQQGALLGPPSPYPTPSAPIAWGYERNGTLCPEYDVLGTERVNFALATPPSYDSLFEFDAPVFSSTGQAVTWSFDVPLPADAYSSVHKSM